MEERVNRAVELFKSGYNCSQSVVAAFADLYGFTEEQALKMAASFGGGIGRMRETCGAACGMFLLAGLETGTTDPKDKEEKAANYQLVQDLAAIFRERNGSLNCGELLGLKKCNPVEATPEERTPQYYAKRPCVKIVEETARIWAEYLENQKK
ncbi:C-GCAxxG-C-C family protein [uncultured Bacteroides sp.]|uniref:C-GCAxxG-C-C family protein n=1 Tax=uncultured Bacteroides sp. TaxID=162156 RepID=UPI002AAAFDA1|nr:C-GCAxxG-C-C family protein [uncultured Bacteroides sp.]